MEESPLAQSASMIWNSSFDNLGVGTRPLLYLFDFLLYLFVIVKGSAVSAANGSSRKPRPWGSVYYHTVRRVVSPIVFPGLSILMFSYKVRDASPR
jgi:hypothetical protein